MGNVHSAGTASPAPSTKASDGGGAVGGTVDARALAAEYTRRVIERKLKANLAGAPPGKHAQQRAAAGDAAAKAAHAMCDRWMSKPKAAAAVADQLPEGWQRVVDRSSGDTYYKHASGRTAFSLTSVRRGAAIKRSFAVSARGPPAAVPGKPADKTAEHNVYVPPRPPPGRTWRTLLRADLFPLRAMWDVGEQEGLYREAYETAEARRRFAGLTGAVGHAADAYAGLGDDEQGGGGAAADADATATAASAPPPVKPPPDRYTVSVVARFKPAKGQKGDADDEAARDPSADLCAADGGGGSSEEEEAAPFLLPLHQRLQLIKLAEGCDNGRALEVLVREGGWSRRARGVEKEPL